MCLCDPHLTARGAEKLALKVGLAVDIRAVAAKLLAKQRLVAVRALPTGFMPQTVARLAEEYRIIRMHA